MLCALWQQLGCDIKLLLHLVITIMFASSSVSLIMCIPLKIFTIWQKGMCLPSKVTLYVPDQPLAFTVKALLHTVTVERRR